LSTNHPALNWVCKPFNVLPPSELYSILRLRSEVFCVEQNCVYLDADNNDQFAWHLMGWQGETLVAYSRILPPGVTFVEASIGRVVTSPALRGTGAGKELMKLSVEKVSELFGNLPIRIGAQLYLKKFYQSFGFVQAGEMYLEDGIEHIEMLKSSSVAVTVQDPT
jgi:ElaA protein